MELEELDFLQMDWFHERVVTDALIEGNLKPEMMKRLREGLAAFVATAM